MTTEDPATPEPGRWPYTEPVEPSQTALPIPEPSPDDVIIYPSDPTEYPLPGEQIPPATQPEPVYQPAPPESYQSPVHVEQPAPWFLDDEPPPPVAEPARAGVGRGVLLGLLLGAVIAATAFGLGRFTASDDAADPLPIVQTTLPTTSLVGTTDPPPVATVPRSDAAVEPIAAAAAAVSPAVVQLDIGGVGTGSGVIYDSAGYILTAAHVVENASTVTVRFADGSSTTGDVLGADEQTDVAVVGIQPGEVPAIAVLATGADLTIGQTAVAVGSPFRLDQTVTSGIISAVDRILDAQGGVSMVQTDAAINPGNSGGPLVDINGRVLGINDVIFTNSGDNAGVGFAISIDVAKIIADQITSGQPTALARLGVQVNRAPDGAAGALIEAVDPDTAADEAGLVAGDVVVAIDGDPVRDPDELRAEVVSKAPGTAVELVVLRDGRQITLTAVLGSIATSSAGN